MSHDMVATRIRNYRDLEIWQEGIALVKELYALTRAFPKDELYGLTSQVRRAAVSVPSNIGVPRIRFPFLVT